MAKTPKKKPELRVVEALDTAEKLFMEGYSDIPPCSVPLCKTAQELYENYCRMMLKRGVLTIPNREHAENYAIGKDVVIKAYSAGKNPPRYATEMMRAAKMKLDRLGLNDEIQTPSAESSNPFVGFGFARRARQARER